LNPAALFVDQDRRVPANGITQIGDQTSQLLAILAIAGE
jgi:hypothetical protein